MEPQQLLFFLSSLCVLNAGQADVSLPQESAAAAVEKWNPTLMYKNE